MICESCGSELEYDEDDLRMGVYGCAFIDCPVCGHDNMLDEDEHSINLTPENIDFPVHFHHTSVEEGAVDICNNKHIRKYLREAIDYFRHNKDDYSSWGGHITGNLYLSVTRLEEDNVYSVTISKDFYDTDIPFEDEDYGY